MNLVFNCDGKLHHLILRFLPIHYFFHFYCILTIGVTILICIIRRLNIGCSNFRLLIICNQHSATYDVPLMHKNSDMNLYLRDFIIHQGRWTT